MDFLRYLFGKKQTANSSEPSKSDKQTTPTKATSADTGNCSLCGGKIAQPPKVRQGALTIVGVNVRTSNFGKTCEKCNKEYHLRCLKYENYDGFLYASCPVCGSSLGVM